MLWLSTLRIIGLGDAKGVTLVNMADYNAVLYFHANYAVGIAASEQCRKHRGDLSDKLHRAWRHR